MECMEEGYLAKILKGDGAKEIKVGEVLIVCLDMFNFSSPWRGGLRLFK